MSRCHGHWCHYHVQLVSSLRYYVGTTDGMTLWSTQVTVSDITMSPPRLAKIDHVTQIQEGRQKTHWYHRPGFHNIKKVQLFFIFNLEPLHILHSMLVLLLLCGAYSWVYIHLHCCFDPFILFYIFVWRLIAFYIINWLMQCYYLLCTHSWKEVVVRIFPEFVCMHLGAVHRRKVL